MRVLVVEEGWSQTLHVAHALEQAGHAVTVVTANDLRASYRRRGVTWTSVPRVASADFVHHLERIACGFDRIVPLTEHAMWRLWESRYADRVFPATADWQRQLVRDKHRLLDFMRERGIAVPRQVPLASARELPAVIKGATGAAGAHVWIADSPDALARARVRAQHLGGAWVAQELIPGPTYLVGGVFHDGVPLRIYAAEKVEQHPPRTGPAIRLRSQNHTPLVELGMRAIGELRWTGVASADVMRRADGSYVLIEINPRPWGSLAAARSAGVDVLSPFVELLAGHVPAADLTFTVGDDCLIFPRYLMAPGYRSLGGLALALRDLRGEQGRDWRDPRFAWHLIRRLLA